MYNVHQHLKSCIKIFKLVSFSIALHKLIFGCNLNLFIKYSNSKDLNVKQHFTLMNAQQFCLIIYKMEWRQENPRKIDVTIVE